MKADFDALAEIGATGDGGVHRPAFSEAHLAARAWYRQRVLAAGLEFHQDGAGNQSAVLLCSSPSAARLLLGSHLDSVPYGGRFDGALGVLAGLEVLRVVQEAGMALPVNLEAIDFTDEEGTLVGLLGSSALAGNLHIKDLSLPRGGREQLLAGLKTAGLSEVSLLGARRGKDRLAGYLELHIEQGQRLVKSGAHIGIVTGIVGIAAYRMMFIGRADHAGTTPMTDRQDASQGASAFILTARKVILEEYPQCTVNVGALQLFPGAFNIVPAQAELAMELRSADAHTMERLEARLLTCAKDAAKTYNLELETEFLGRHLPAEMSPVAQETIAQAAEALGLKHLYLVSGAGHDAQSLAELCPAGMIFIPSIGGASHSWREYSEWGDCINGANVLLGAALRMATLA